MYLQREKIFLDIVDKFGMFSIFLLEKEESDKLEVRKIGHIFKDKFKLNTTFPIFLVKKESLRIPTESEYHKICLEDKNFVNRRYFKGN